jgi:arylsulfatase A-like enzyme
VSTPPRLAVLAALATVLSLTIWLPGCTRDARPSVLVVTIDTLRADHTSAYGYSVPTTPELVRIAADGVLFERAYSMTSTTGPSHAALLTGRYPRSMGVLKNGHIVDDDELLLSEILGFQGYQTAAFVSSFPVRAKFGFDQGFELFDESFSLEESSLGSPSYRRGRNRIAQYTSRRFLYWLRTTDGGPWFSWVHFVDPHSPYKAPDKFEAQWPPGTSGLVKKYDEEIHYADSWLGKIYDEALAGAGPGGLLFVVTSDHGEGLGDHKWLGHGVNLYEEAVRVPMVAVWKGHFEAGTRVIEPVSLIDVLPTVLAAVGEAVPENVDGQGLFGAHRTLDRPIVLQRRSYASNRDQGHDVQGDLMGVVQWPQKFLAVSGGPAELEAPDSGRLDDTEGRHSDGRELYDLSVDPREKDNIAADRPRRVHTLVRDLARWQEATPEPGHEQADLSEDDKRHLRALGYVD